jgi:beta-xylosidase
MTQDTSIPRMRGNPLFPGWYADPELHFFEGRYYLYPTTSSDPYATASFERWSSVDLTDWRKGGVILSFADVPWSTNYAAWAPSCARSPHDGTYYFYFSAGDGAGLGVAVSDSPAGPFKDAIGRPLVGYYPHGAQPIDAHCFVDDDGQAYLYFGGHGVCVAASLTWTFCAINRDFRNITPSPGYVENPAMVKRVASII